MLKAAKRSLHLPHKAFELTLKILVHRMCPCCHVICRPCQCSSIRFNSLQALFHPFRFTSTQRPLEGTSSSIMNGATWTALASEAHVFGPRLAVRRRDFPRIREFGGEKTGVVSGEVQRGTRICDVSGTRCAITSPKHQYLQFCFFFCFCCFFLHTTAQIRSLGMSASVSHAKRVPTEVLPRGLKSHFAKK